MSAAVPPSPDAGSLRRLRARAAAAWRGILDTPGGPGRVARGVASGAFAAMVPAFGLHVLIAFAAAWLARGSGVAATAACLLIGNPLTHLATVPVAFEIGRRLLPLPPVPREDWLPSWFTELLPVAEEALAGGAVLGLAAAVIAYAVTRRALRGRRPMDG